MYGDVRIAFSEAKNRKTFFIRKVAGTHGDVNADGTLTCPCVFL